MPCVRVEHYEGQTLCARSGCDVLQHSLCGRLGLRRVAEAEAQGDGAPEPPEGNCRVLRRRVVPEEVYHGRKGAVRLRAQTPTSAGRAKPVTLIRMGEPAAPRGTRGGRRRDGALHLEGPRQTVLADREVAVGARRCRFGRHVPTQARYLGVLATRRGKRCSRLFPVARDDGPPPRRHLGATEDR